MNAEMNNTARQILRVCATSPITYRQIRLTVGPMPNLKKTLMTLIETGQIRRYGVRHCFDSGNDELYVCTSHQVGRKPLVSMPCDETVT